MDYIEDKVKIDSNKILCYLGFSKRLFKVRGFKHDTTLLTEAMQKHKECPALMIEFAKLKFVTQSYQEAADSFAAALKYKDVDYEQTMYNLGLCYLYWDKPDHAISHFKYSLHDIEIGIYWQENQII